MRLLSVMYFLEKKYPSWNTLTPTISIKGKETNTQRRIGRGRNQNGRKDLKVEKGEVVEEE